MDDLPPEFTDEEYKTAIPAVMERLVALGWIVPHPNTKGVGDLVWTHEGEIARRMLRSFLIATGKGSNPGVEHSLFNQIVVTSPAGQETN